MGDFVDRGFYSVETFLLLLALKVSSHLSIASLDISLVFKYMLRIVVDLSLGGSLLFA